LVRAIEESQARYAEREGKEGLRRPVAGFKSGGEYVILSAASLCLCVTRSGIRGRQDSTERIPVGIAAKQFVVYLWTLCQKVFRWAIVPALGVKRSAL